MDKYLFTVSGRYDGSSRLADGNKWAFFPSAAFAWMLGEEEFIKKVDFISSLKLRLSYGVTGNDAVSIYGTQSNVSIGITILEVMFQLLIIKTVLLIVN